MTIHPTNHIDYSRGDRVDHLFIVGDEVRRGVFDQTALLVSVTDTGLDCVLDDYGTGSPQTKGWSLTWAEVLSAVQESDHNGVVTLTTVRSTADEDDVFEDPRLCDCGKGDWCPLWDTWDGPGKAQRDERANAEVVMLEEHSGTLESFLTEMADLRRRVEETLSNG